MSKPWNPRRSGFAGQWDRHRWPMPKRRGRIVGWGEIGLMLLLGVSLGLGAVLLPPAEMARPLGGAAVNDPQAVRVVDGDTFDYGGVRIRIADIDAPERQGECEAEIRLAEQATERLGVLLSGAPFALAPVGDRDEDRYGRKLRIVTRGGASIGGLLIAEGLARPWRGRRLPWCS